MQPLEPFETNVRINSLKCFSRAFPGVAWVKIYAIAPRDGRICLFRLESVYISCVCTRANARIDTCKTIFVFRARFYRFRTRHSAAPASGDCRPMQMGRRQIRITRLLGLVSSLPGLFSICMPAACPLESQGGPHPSRRAAPLFALLRHRVSR